MCDNYIIIIMINIIITVSIITYMVIMSFFIKYFFVFYCGKMKNDLLSYYKLSLTQVSRKKYIFLSVTLLHNSLFVQNFISSAVYFMHRFIYRVINLFALQKVSVHNNILL